MQYFLVCFVVCILAVAAGDRAPGVVQLTAVILTLCMLVRLRRFQPRPRLLWCTGLSALVFIFLTTIPLPDLLVGSQRSAYFDRAEEAVTSLKKISPVNKSEADLNKRSRQGKKKDYLIRPGYTLNYSVPSAWGVAGLYSNSYGHFSAEEISADRVPGSKFAVFNEDKKDSDFVHDKGAEKIELSSSLSLNRVGTVRTFLTLAGAWAAFWLVSSLSFRQRRKFLRIVMVIGACIVFSGLVGFGAVSGDLLGWLYPFTGDPETAISITRSHFASYCALLTPVAITFIIAPRLRSQHSSRTAEQYENRGLGGWRIAAIICLAIFLWGAVASRSSGGVLALVCGGGAVLAIAVRVRLVTAIAAFIVVGVISLAVIFWPSEVIRHEWFPEVGSNSPLVRPIIWKAGFEQWADYPIVGGGTESTRALQSIYKSKADSHSPLYCDNEFIQVLADNGLVGLLLLGGLFSAYVMAVLRPAAERDSSTRRKHSGMVPIPLLAISLGVLAALCFQSTVDFPLRRPLIAYTAGALLAAAMPFNCRTVSKLSEGAETQNEGSSGFVKCNFTLFQKCFRNISRFLACRFVVLAYVVLVVIIAFHYRAPRLQYDRPDFLLQGSPSQLTAALAQVPSYWLVWHQLGLAAMRHDGRAC